jgi:LPXTG-motif cell wall-anchored protein
MQDNTLWILIGAVVVLGLVFWLVARRRNSAVLREHFGDEYDRTVEARGGVGKAERELEEREERVKKLDIRPLGPKERGEFIDEWREVKAVFVDSPVEAVHHADRLLARIMTARGFPMGDFDRRYEDLTVDHGEVARHYRAGHDAVVRDGRGEASTEDLRQAMIHFEALFDDLVNEVSGVDKTRPVTRAATTKRRVDRDGDADTVTQTQTADGRPIRPN